MSIVLSSYFQLSNSGVLYKLALCIVHGGVGLWYSGHAQAVRGRSIIRSRRITVPNTTTPHHLAN